MTRGFSGRIEPGNGLIVPEGALEPEEALGCQILFDGHISNRKALGITLGLSPIERADNVRLIGSAYRAWGAGLAEHVLGEFALALYDSGSGESLLTHDSLGMAALYLDAGPGVRFATHIVDLIDATAMDSLDAEYLADFIAQGVITTERTPYSSIRRLPAGRSVVIEGVKKTEHRHWALADVAPVRLANDEAYREQFRALLFDAVQGTTDGAEVVWGHLSGGLDSSSIVSIAALAGVQGLAAWSVYCPSFPQADERHWMQLVIDRFPMPWHLVDAEERPPFSAPPARFIGEPTIAVVNGGQARETNKMLRENGVDAILSGHGGDAVLGGFPGSEIIDLADGLMEGDFLATLREVQRWRERSPERRSLLHWLVRGLAQPTIQHLRGRAISSAPRLPLQHWISPHYRSTTNLESRRHRAYADRCRTPGRQQLADSLHVAALQMARDNQRPDVVPVRCPLMHRPLVEFMAGVPLDQRMRPRCDRYLQRHALKDILPDPIRRRSGKGIGTPVFANGLARSRDWIDYLTTDSRLAAMGIADAGAWTRAVHQASVGQTNGDQFFHAGLAVEVWLRQLEDHRAVLADRSTR